MRVLLRRFGGFDHADARKDRAIGTARPLAGTVLDAKIERVDLELLANFIDDGFRRHRRVGGAGSAVGACRGLVHDHIVAVDHDVRDVVAGEDAHGARADG
jgi:hypothetical protein